MMRTCVAALIFLVALVPLQAQWLNYPTPGIPRLPNGKPNLTAPAPRTANRKPDLSGIWRLESARCNPNTVGTCEQDYNGGPEFGNIAARLNGDLPYQPWAAELVKKLEQGGGKDDPVALCQPAGALRLLTYPPPRKIVQNPAHSDSVGARRYLPADLH